MFGVIAMAVVQGVQRGIAERDRRQAEIARLPASEREARIEFYARRDHESRMEAIAQEQARAAASRPTSALAFIAGLLIGGSGK